MSTPATTTIPFDGFTIAKIFGPMFWGIILNLVGYGVGLLQALDYFRSGVNDSLRIRASVSAPPSSKFSVNRLFKALFMILLSTTSTVLITSVFWTDLVVHFGGVEQFGGTNTRLGGECVITGLVAFFAQIYFINQLRHVKPEGRIGNAVLWAIGILSFIGLAFGMGCASVMLLLKTTPHWSKYFELTFAGAKGANSLCDIVATIAMCKYLTSSKTGIKSTASLLEALTRFFFHRGAAVMVLQSLSFMMFFAFKSPQYWLAPHLLLTKLYVSTFFAILNSRAYLRDKYLTKDPTTGFSSSLTGPMHFRSFHTAASSEKPTQSSQAGTQPSFIDMVCLLPLMSSMAHLDLSRPNGRERHGLRVRLGHLGRIKDGRDDCA
ncbi:hypothetical protein GGX14DRAFT_557970 [Mycena pura]|uniref:DUF6534 domain-containing protein n=1 Tax=Mycena pura TaxID=153505 RepID=A0AAD7E216_9AGAR|nr:hypothetical protein GGX14DRAFT_557970 [Mycena pura]